VNTRRRQLRSHRRASNMHADGLPFAELFAPVVLILGAAYLLGPTLPLSRPAARLAVFAIVWLVIVRYLSWRIFSTVLPAHGTWYEVGWIWLCFSVELFRAN
jgi:hypothetical protein